jgi:CRP-like cAMP-binding protein
MLMPEPYQSGHDSYAPADGRSRARHQSDHLPPGQLQRLAASNVDVAGQLWSMTAKSLQHAEAHMLLLGRRTALERVAAFIMDLDARLGRTGSIELPMSRRDIADYLGLTLETVSRSMSQLQNGHAMALSGARRVVLDKRMMNALVED